MEMMITDSNVFINNNDNTCVEADGIYNEEGMISEDNKKKKKTKQIIIS